MEAWSKLRKARVSEAEQNKKNTVKKANRFPQSLLAFSYVTFQNQDTVSRNLMLTQGAPSAKESNLFGMSINRRHLFKMYHIFHDPYKVVVFCLHA